MKFTASLSDFHKVLQKTLPAIPPKSTIPVLEHLHFSLEKNILSVIATDQDITIMTSIEVTGLEDGKILVPGRRLNDILKAQEGKKDFEFAAVQDTFEIQLKIERGKYLMKGLNPEEYLNIPELFDQQKPEFDAAEVVDTENRINAEFTKADLMKLASKTAFAVSTDEFRPAMTGVLFQFRGTYVNAVATDSYRLAYVVVRSEENNYPSELDIIIPARSVDLLKKLDEDVKMSIIETQEKITHVRFDIGNTVFITRIINERFPPYESVIPKDNNLIVLVDQRQLLGAIRRVAIQTSIISKQIKMTLDNDTMTISGRDEEYGTEGDESIECTYSGELIDIGFNYKYLEEALQNIEVDSKTDYQVQLTFSEATRPSLVRPKNESDEMLMLIMPVRLS
jgi:DNA polymerase III subunit beta